MFQPPRCPFRDCAAHAHPERVGGRRFFRRNGSYQPKCRAVPVPRFRCKSCGRGFSRQTFRMDYGDNKPHLNAQLFKLLASGMGLRQSARILPLSRRCTELKARKIGRHLGRINRNLTDRFPPDARFMLDEMETFEGERGVLPVSVPVLIESRSMYVIGTDVATIKPSGRLNAERRRAIQRAEARHGPREDRSRAALERVFKRLRYFAGHLPSVDFVSDRKQLYGRLLRRYLGAAARHTRISSRLPRDQRNPLKHINLTNAMARDLTGRLRRESWLVSKARRFLRLQLYVFAAFRNFVRRRINRKRPTPAQILGFLPRPVRFDELLTWRQDWRWSSIHPLAAGGDRSIADVRRRRAAA